jgi:alpha-glucosidase
MLHPARFDFLQRIHELMAEFPGTVTLGEVSSQDGAFDRCRDYTASGQHLHMAYTLKPLRHGFSHAAMQALVDEAATDSGWLCWNFSNHDVERAVGRWNPEPGLPPDPRFARLLAAFQLSLRGSVCIYQGEELGLQDAMLEEADLRDPFGIAYWPEFRGRDGSRTPMPWHETKVNGGFSEAKPWLPMPDAHLPMSVDTQERDSGSVLNDWRGLLRFRRENAVLRHGTLHKLAVAAPLIGFVREDSRQRIVCLFNFSAATVSLADVPGCGADLPPVLPPYGCTLARAGMQVFAEAAD